MRSEVAELFHELADLPAAGRSRYFAEHAVDDEIRREVEELLAHDSTGAEALLRHIGSAAGGALLRLDAKGARCGPYRLVRVIGRGGMGVVYLAERVDGEVTQRAAVKLLQPGLNEGQRERFLQERQILAALTHPNIAHLLDAGHLQDGQPFLAMEYVEGKPIDAYAAALPTREKILLFLKVCAAVAYLHRNLVVHRDLKPGNIFVNEQGEPKLLDFGIAKILDLVTDTTVTNLRMLTPDYASPEQVAGGLIGTASDIYSLGAVLRRLLDGNARGDLELIILKAMRAEPHERYLTVEQFADDLEAFLESRPIRARKGDVAYRVRKLARRFWLPLSAAVLIGAALSAGLVIANRERAIAQRRFNEVRQLANRLFDIDKQVRLLPGGARTRQLIVDTALEYLRRLADEAPRDPDLALDVGTAYMRVGRVQGVPISPNLGQLDNAEQNLRIAGRLIHAVLEKQPANRTAILRAAQIAHDRMILAEHQRPPKDALPLARVSEQWLNKYRAAGVQSTDDAEAVVITGMNIAHWYVHEELREEALALIRKTVAFALATNQPRQAGAAHIVMARALWKSGDLDGALAAIRESARLLEPERGIKQVSPLLKFAMALSTQADILAAESNANLGRPKEAAELLERAVGIARDLVGQDALDTESRFSLSSDGIALAGLVGRWDARRAVEIYDEVLSRMAEIKNNPRARRDEVAALAGSAKPLIRLGRAAEARRRLELAFARLRDMKRYPAATIEPCSEPDGTLRAQAELEAATGNVPGGLEIYEQLGARIAAAGPRPENVLADAACLSSLDEARAALLRRARQSQAAAAVDSRRRDLWRSWQRKLPGNSFVARQIASSSSTSQ